MNRLEKQLLIDEGYRQFPYKDSVGKLTIGIGRNIEDNGIAKDEAIYLLRRDIANTRVELMQFRWFNRLNEARKEALINMCFNLGLTTLLKFKNMISALDDMNYDLAAEEALDSRWSEQVGERAQRIARIIKYGDYV